jgi:predicted O-linked N-acetylglucosamine transferase (SPINDLY family)
VFIRHAVSAEITNLFRERLEKAFAAFELKADDHCVFLERLNQSEFVAATGQCDIFLDSLDWSGCNTALESLDHALPIVTMRGPLMRGRHSAAILERIGVTETIAPSLDDYVGIAVRLGHDEAWRGEIRERMHRHKHRVYRDQSCIAALEEFLHKAAHEMLDDAPRPKEE